MAAWTDGWWWSRDGIRLHFRDYPGDPARVPLVCLPGLTRNARDFEGLAARVAGRRRVVAVSLRGRGESGYAKDPLSYVPLTYVQDLEALFEAERLDRVALVGTSLGGILSMLLAAADPARVAGVLLNDIGPTVESAGLERIRHYVGRAPGWPTWLHAARDMAALHGAGFPGYATGDWLALTKRLARVAPSGRIVLDYDPRIAEPFRLPAAAAPADLWGTLPALADKPVLLVRGALSDILSAATAERMNEVLPRLAYVELPDIGHAPTLDEPAAVAATETWLEAVDWSAHEDAAGGH